MVYPTQSYDFVEGEVLLFDKGLAWSSFDLVQKVRNSLCRSLGMKKLKVGHAGTLDPLATGLMIMCTGKATKQIELIQDGIKVYIATLKIGATTPSFDRETEEDQTFDFSYVTKENVKEAAFRLTGEIDQVPPLFSAVWIDGHRAYKYARNGVDVKLNPRRVVVESMEIQKFEPPLVELKVVCSKGTYIRSLARDLGAALGCGAYLTGLRRIRIGDYNVEDAMTIDYFLNNIQTFVTNK
jgi:tRNA pseudouridine55 synthase